MADQKRIPKVDPIAARVADGGSPVVEIHGYVGAITDSTIRLMATRDGSAYLDIPRAGVVEFVDRDDAPSTLFIAEETQLEVTSAQRATVTAAALGGAGGGAGLRPHGLAFARAAGSGSDEPVPGNNCKLECDRDLLNCLESPLPEALCRYSWSVCYENCRTGTGGSSLGGIGGVIA